MAAAPPALLQDIPPDIVGKKGAAAPPAHLQDIPPDIVGKKGDSSVPVFAPLFIIVIGILLFYAIL